MPQGASSGIFLPDKEFLLELSGKILRAVCRKTCRRDPGSCSTPSLDLFNPARAARIVRARAFPVKPAVLNCLCLNTANLSGPGRQKRRAPRLRPVPSDVRCLRRELQPPLPWPCHRWGFLSRWRVSAARFAGCFGCNGSIPPHAPVAPAAKRAAIRKLHAEPFDMGPSEIFRLCRKKRISKK